MKKAIACGEEVVVIKTYYHTRALDTISEVKSVKTGRIFSVKAELIKYVSDDPDDPFSE